MFDDIDKIDRPHDDQDAENTSNLPSSDEALLLTVDRVQAGTSLSSPHLADPHTPESFIALIAGSRAQASEPFKADLLTRLQDEMAGSAQVEAISASTTEDPTTEDKAEATIPTPSRAPARRSDKPRGERPFPLPIPVLTRGTDRGKWQRLVLSALGIAAMLAMLFGLALVLKVRKDVTTGANATPTSLAISGVGTPGVGGGIAVGPPVRVTPVDARSLIPKLQKLYTVPAASFGKWGAWSPDGKMLATQLGSVVQIWDAASGALKSNVVIERWHSMWDYRLEWSPDGRTLAVDSGDGDVQLFSVSDGANLLTLSPPQPGQLSNGIDPSNPGIFRAWYKMGCNCPPTPVLSAAWSPDGRLLASVQQIPIPNPDDAEFVFRSVANVWDVTTGTIAHRFEVPDDELAKPITNTSGGAGYPTPIVQVTWSPDGKMLAALFANHVVAVWDVATGAKLQTMYDPGVYRDVSEALSLIQWLPDSRNIVQAQRDYSVLWDVQTGKPRTMPAPPPPTVLEDSDVPTVDPQIAPFVATPTPWPTYVYDAEQYGLLKAFALSPLGDKIATLDSGTYPWGGRILRLWDVASGNEIHKAMLTPAENSQLGDISPNAVLGWSPDDQFVLYSVDDMRLTDSIKLMDTATDSELRTLTADRVQSTEWSPDGSMLAILASDGLEVWGDPATRTVIPTTTPAPTAAPLCGQWSIADVPAVGTQGDLRSMAALGENDVWAVGSHHIKTPAQGKAGAGRVYNTLVPDIASSLILHWDGSNWQSVTPPIVGDADNRLMGVAGVAPNDVWAVGYYGDVYYADPNVSTPTEHGLTHSLILHWDGKVWSVVATPQAGKNSNRLLAVTAIASDDVWAVGYTGYYDYAGAAPSSTATPTAPLILHWDGTIWSQVPSPSPGLIRNELYGISAISKHAIWAVGGYTSDSFDPEWEGNGYFSVQPLMLFWDGKSWTWTPAPGAGSAFTGIAAIANDSAWAVGPNNLMHWDGKNWAKAPFPALPTDKQGGQPVPATGDLTSVLAVKPDDIWAAGSLDSNSGDTPVTLSIHWDGAKWSYVPAGHQGSPKVVYNLAGLAASPSGQLWAVGSSSTSGLELYPYVLRYDNATCSP